MSNDRTPARLFTLLARDAPVGVIFRRGPSRWTQLIHWDTANDIFTAGQWFKGQIYPRKSDLSPNGSLLIYFAHKPFNHRANPTYGDQWTAISKPPYFTALALWQFRGSITDGGGGYFTTSKRVILEHYYYGDNQTPHPAHPPSGVKVEYLEEDTFSRNLYYELLRMRGWKSSFAPEASRFGVPKIHVDGQWHRKWQSKLIWLKSNNHFMIKHRIFFDLSFLLRVQDDDSTKPFGYP